jgi:hypothetical protein
MFPSLLIAPARSSGPAHSLRALLQQRRDVDHILNM